MVNEQILNMEKDRLKKLESNGKNVKSMGVVRKLRRRIRNMEK